MIRRVADLRDAGMSASHARAKHERLAGLRARLDCRVGASRERTAAWFVPGRIEVLGKHTDYAGGRSLLCAAEHGFLVVSVPRSDARIVVTDRRRDVSVAATLDSADERTSRGWANYVGTVARRFARDLPGARRGAEIVLQSDLPPAAGMSSSSALMIGVFLALADANDLWSDPRFRAVVKGPLDLAAYLATVENGEAFGPFASDRGVGTAGGGEDHTAILCCREGRLSQYAFCPPREERTFPFPDNLLFVVATSGVQASKTGPAQEQYNRTSRSVQRMLELWCAGTGRRDGSLGAALSSGADAPDCLRRLIRGSGESAGVIQSLLERLEQFIEESEVIVPAGAERLACGDLAGFGALVDRSQSGAERLLGNQVPETIELARSARRLGAVAASAFGAGFGGSVWALVPASDDAAFAARWAAAFAPACPAAAGRSAVLLTRPGPGAVRLDLAG